MYHKDLQYTHSSYLIEVFGLTEIDMKSQIFIYRMLAVELQEMQT